MKSKIFPCGGCKKAFTSILSLKRHFKTFHMQEKVYSCQACDNTETPQTSAEKSVDQKRKVSDMTPNVENETLKKPKRYSCQACEKSYTQSHSLKTHILTVHRGQKYYCQACDKSYTHSHSLKTHIQKVHEGLKLPQSSSGIKNEFTPDEVDRITPNVENETLKKPKQYSCQACDKSFARSPSLKRHILTVHRGQKPYYCQACDKSYTQSSSLKTHILTFHRGQKYSCQACDKSFTRYHALKTHIQKVHEGLKLPQSSAGIKNEFTPDEVDRMTPNVENETLKKPKWTRGQKRKKSMPQGKIFKQIHLEALLDALNSEFGL